MSLAGDDAFRGGKQDCEKVSVGSDWRPAYIAFISFGLQAQYVNTPI